MWPPCEAPPWHVQMSIGSVRRQLWASDGGPSATHSAEWDCWMWHLNFFFYVRCFRHTHTHLSTPKSVRQWHRWERHPRGSDVRRGQQWKCKSLPHPVSITIMNRALCEIHCTQGGNLAIPGGWEGTGLGEGGGGRLPHPELSVQASFLLSHCTQNL